MKPLVSIIINCYNSEKYIKQTIDSVLSQTYDNWEIIFYDNASTDNTREIISFYNNVNFIIFTSPNNILLGAARNEAIKLAKGEYIAFLDSDDYWHPNKLEKQILIFQENLNTGLVYTDAIYFNTSEKKMRLYEYRKYYIGNCIQPLLLDYFLCMSSCMIKKSIIINYNIEFDNNLLVCEDPDYFIQIALRSDFSYCDFPLTYYRIHDKSLTAQNRELFFTELSYIMDKLSSYVYSEKKISFILNLAKKRNIINKSKYYWSINETNKAFRELTYNFRFNNFKYILLFCIPYSLVLYIYKIIHPNRVSY